jgi:hypothetical protein
VQKLAQSSRWHHQVVFELRTRCAQNVGINSHRLFIPKHGGEWISANVWKIGEGRQ